MSDIVLSADYLSFVEAIKERVRTAQIRASLSVNQELVLLYWRIGKDILNRQERLGWGAKVVVQVAKDLRRAFPEMKGFSSRNLKYMRAFAEAWPDEEFVQQAAAQIPWFHNVVIIQKVKEPEARRFYVESTWVHGWSRSILGLQIEQRRHQRQGQAISNFERTLPSSQSDLAQQITKDPYCFDFLTLAGDAHERDFGGGMTHENISKRIHRGGGSEGFVLR